MANEKAKERDQLVYQFAILISPFEDLLRTEPPPGLAEYRVAVAKVQSGDAAWRRLVNAFTTFSPDVVFTVEASDISHVPEILRRQLRPLLEDPKSADDPTALQEGLRSQLEGAKRRFFEFLARVPVEWEPVVFQANTPFTSYLAIRDALAVVSHRIHYFDRYLKPEFFSLFLRNISPSISIRLVTTAGNQTFGVTAVSSVSELVRREFADYQLLEADPNAFHDRNLRIDDQVFTLGPGIDRAGISLTNFGPADSTPVSHAAFDKLLAEARVIHSS